MKTNKFYNILLLAIVIGLGIYIIWDNENQTNRDKLVDSQLKAKDKVISKHASEVAEIALQRAIIKNSLIDTVADNKALRIELEKKPKIKIKYKDRIVEVIKFETLPDCQINLNLCLQKSQSLEQAVSEYININTKLDLKNIELDKEILDKTEILVNERLEYKKAKRRSTIQKGALGLFALIILVVK